MQYFIKRFHKECILINNIGLYIHIPFCDGKCPYCDFFSKKANEAEINRYVDNVLQKMAYYAQFSKCKADTLYIGGGTPALCGTDNLIKIIRCAKKYFLTDMYEATFEINPTSQELVDFERLHKAGFNRVSIGLQSANENELMLLGRKHTAQAAAYTVAEARKGGFDNISLDVMLAIPEQTAKSLKHTIDFCNDCAVEHISAYILKIEEGTPFAVNKNNIKFFDDDAQADFYNFACEYISSLGFSQYEISNFCKNNKESRHNLKYWNCDEYLGIGASAHSFFNGKRFYYPRNIDDFYNNRTVSDGTGGDAEEYIMLRLRLAQGLIYDDFLKKYNRKFSAELCAERLGKLINSNLMILDNTHLALTQQGFLLSNYIISEIIDTVSSAINKH